jgi:hypothetical protein
MSTDPPQRQHPADPPPPPPPISPARALKLFVESGIGAEGVPSTATSELMLRTATKAVGSAATLVDSPSFGLSGAKPVTKTIRGAGVGVYLLSETLGGKGIKRGLGLFVLAIGGALVATSLITGTAPAWMATLGFALLLGGLAHAALASGSLALALVLGTPVVPLLVWSATRSSGGQGDGRNGVQVVLIALLVGTLLAIGTVRDPQRRPSSWLKLRPVLTLVIALLVVLTIAVIVREVAIELPAVLTIVLPWVVGVVLVILAALAARHALRVGRIAETEPGAASGAAIATAWALIFGSLYAVLALGCLFALKRYPDLQPDVENLLMSLLATFVVLAAVCFVLCLRMKPPQVRQGLHRVGSNS